MSEEKLSIPEKDKPFILALVSSAITVTCIAITAVGAWFGNTEMTERGVEMLKFLFPLTTMSWGFYFKGSK